MPTLKTIRVQGGKSKTKLPWLLLATLTLILLVWTAYVGNHHHWQTTSQQQQQHTTKATDQQLEPIHDNDNTSDTDYHNTDHHQQHTPNTIPQPPHQTSSSKTGVVPVLEVPTSPSPLPRPDLVSFLSHHNAGSDALSCILSILTSSLNTDGSESSTSSTTTTTTTNLKKPTVPLTSPPTKIDLLNALHANQYYYSVGGGGGTGYKINTNTNRPPAVFFSPEALEMECFKMKNDSMCQYSSCPCGSVTDDTRNSSSSNSGSPAQCLQDQHHQSCYIPLPFVHHSILHLIRNPVDIIVASYFKKTDSVGAMGDETTLQLTLKKAFHSALQSGVAMDDLLLLLPDNGDDVAMQDGTAGSSTTNAAAYFNGRGKKTYGEVLRELPLEKGILLEFWRAVPALYSMARQHQILGRLDYVTTVKVEEEEEGGRSQVGRKIEEMLKRSGISIANNNNMVADATKQCLAHMMTPQSLSSSGLSGGSEEIMAKKWNRAVDALFGDEVVGLKLCELLTMLGYPSTNYKCHV